MKPNFRKAALSVSLSALLGLAACGGGGGSAPAATTTAVPTTVIDGAISNALVCLDKNQNGACDSGEPSVRTDASGNGTLQVDNADVGKYPILAIVGTDAVDADHGPVTVPFTLKAPADKPAVVSPLTTLAQAHIETNGGTSAEAAAAVKDQLGLDVAVFSDFTKDSSTTGQQAGTVARMIVVATQEQKTTTSGATGIDGTALTAAQIDAAINARLLQLLPTMALKMLDSPVLSDPAASAADRQAAMLAAAQQVAQEAGLSKENIGYVVAAATATPSSTPEAPTFTASLRWFEYTNAQNWFQRIFMSTAEQNTPDSAGKRYFTEERYRAIGGVEETWGENPMGWTRTQNFWTGTEWFNCLPSQVHETTGPNAAGETESLYCKSFKTRDKRSERDIAGRKIIDVIREIRAYPLADSAGKFSNWGPNPDDSSIQTLLGDTVFPAGSKLRYQTTVNYENPESYERSSAGRATIPPAEAPMTTTIAAWRTTTLAGFTAWNSGDLKGAVSDVHGNNARVLLNRDYVKANGAAAYKRYMVAFNDTTLAARFYECEGNMASRAETPPRNSTLYVEGVSTCKGILDTTYAIADVGDAKVLRFASQPTQLGNTQKYLFVERGGFARTGFQDKVITNNQLRLNLPATEALFEAVGLN